MKRAPKRKGRRERAAKVPRATTRTARLLEFFQSLLYGDDAEIMQRLDQLDEGDRARMIVRATEIARRGLRGRP
jgi:hypothetical protein